MQGALVHYVNTVSVELLMQVGIDSVLELAQNAGIESNLPAVPSLALGTGAVSLYEMVGVDRDMAMEALRLASHKLSVKTRFIERSDQ